MASDLSPILPRVLIVSRRTLRKNKFVDFVGEYHLDLIVRNGAVPVIVPRVSGVHMLLDSYEPIHGVLLCEGEDVDPSLYAAEATGLSPEDVEEIRRLHAGDTAVDREKDSIEMSLAKLCLERNVPCLGICRGSQVLNVACGGSLHLDIDTEVSRKLPEGAERVAHIDYDNYDGHRHAVRVVEDTPLHGWFADSVVARERRIEILVNSYHHQGVKRLADRFVPMAVAPDGLVEGFYDPDCYDPEEGQFIVGLQFHPERMKRPNSEDFDYPGCPRAYQQFVKAVTAYQRKLINSSINLVPKPPLKQDTKMKKKIIVRSFSIARELYTKSSPLNPVEESEHEVSAQFLESNTVLSLQQEKRLKQMGATVRNGMHYMQTLKLNEEKEKETMAIKVLGQMSVDQLSDLMSFYHLRGQICSQVLENKLHGIITDFAP